MYHGLRKVSVDNVYQCYTPKGQEVPNLVMNSLVNAVKFTGSIGVVGVFVPQDPGGADQLAKKGEVAFDFGKFWFKGQRIGTGQCNVKAYNRKLMELIHNERANPSAIISHELLLNGAPDAYKNFDARHWMAQGDSLPPSSLDIVEERALLSPGASGSSQSTSQGRVCDASAKGRSLQSSPLVT